MRTRKFGLMALAFGATMFGAACEDKDDVVVDPPVTVITLNIAPDPVPALNVGQKVQLVAIVSGTATQTATWSSSNTAVATVNATGEVTAVGAGVAVITAVSTVDATARDAVTVQVNTVTPPTPPGQVTVSINSINQNGTNIPVNPGNVAGRIDVIANVDVPAGVSASAVTVSLVGPSPSTTATEVCRQSFAGGGSFDDATQSVPVIITCTINTAELTATGAPRFPNGTYNVRVNVLNSTGASIASATSQPLTVNNVNALGVTATASGATAQDAAGLTWATGDLTVNVTPAIFTGTSQPSSVTITVRDNGVENAGAIIAQRTVSTATNNVFTTTFTKAANATSPNSDVAEAEGQIQIDVTSVLSGNAGPNATVTTFPTNPLRLDNRAPDDTDADGTVATFTNPPNNWYGASTSLSSTARVANLAELSDEGVNVNTVSYQYTTDLTGASGWTNFATTGDLPQTTTTSGFLVRAVVCDRLGNCVNVTSATPTGADVAAPTMSVVSTNDIVIETEAERTGTVEIVVSGTENLSGFPANFVEVQLIRTRLVGGVATTECLDLAGAVTNDDNAATAAPAIPAAGCAFIAQGSTNIEIPTGDDGYYQVSGRLIDQAGNRSASTTTTFLVDDTAPTATVAGLTFTSNTVTVNGTVSDNVDLASWQVEERFAGAAGITDRLPFAAMNAAGTFGLPMTNSVSASGSAPLVRQLDGVALSHVGFGALDVANNYGRGEIAFGAPTAGNGIDNAAAVGLTTPAPTSSGPFICRSGSSAAAAGSTATSTPASGCGSPTNAGVTSRTITFTATTNPDTQNPIANVYFYAMVPASNGTSYPVLIGQDATADLTILTPGNTRNWSYTSTLSNSMLPPRTAFSPANYYDVTVFAVATDAQGDAVSTAGTTVQVR